MRHLFASPHFSPCLSQSGQKAAPAHNVVTKANCQLAHAFCACVRGNISSFQQIPVVYICCSRKRNLKTVEKQSVCLFYSTFDQSRFSAPWMIWLNSFWRRQLWGLRISVPFTMTVFVYDGPPLAGFPGVQVVPTVWGTPGRVGSLTDTDGPTGRKPAVGLVCSGLK